MGENVASFVLTARDETAAAFTSAEGKLAGLAEKVIAFAAAYLTLEKVTESIEHSFENIDKTAKEADKLGTTPAALQSLQLAAERAGAGTDVLDGAIEKMVKNVGQAESRMGTALPYFERWNIDLQQFAKLDAAEQFRIIAEHLNKLPSEAQQAAATVAIFGRSGQDIQNLIKQGGAALEEATAQGKAWGNVLSEIDTRKVEDAHDQLIAAKQAAEGLADRVAVMLAPYIRQLSVDFQGAATKTQGFKDEVTKTDSVLEDTVAFIADAGHGVSVVWSGVVAIFQTLGAAIVAVGYHVLEALVTPFVKAEHALNDVIAVIDRITGAHIQPIKFFDEKESEIAGTMDAQFKRMDDAWSKFGDKLNEPMPSEGIHRWFENARASAQDAAAKIAASLKSATGGKDGGVAFTPEEIAKFQAQLTQIEGMTGDAVVKVENEYKKEYAALDVLKQKGFVDDQKYAKLREQLETQEQQKITQAAIKGEIQRETFQRLSLGLQVANVTNSLQQMTASTASTNRTMFEINKAAGIANAIVNTALGVSKSLSAYPMPLAAVMAAVSLVAGLAQIEAIKNASFDGGGAPAAIPSATTPTIDNQQVSVSQTVVPGGTATTKPSNGSSGPSVVYQDNRSQDFRGTTVDNELKLRTAMMQATQEAVAQVRDLARQGRLTN